jgi:3-hydroxyacyl-[acyl-carrier-protein] dehydratase
MRLEYFQLVDRIDAFDLGARTIGVSCQVPDSSPVLEGHFPGYPILPGVLMIETMAQTGGWLIMGLLRFTRMAFLAQVKEAKCRAFVQPGQALDVHATIEHEGSGYAMASARIRSAGKPVADANITYRVLPFPNETARTALLDVARRINVPAELLGD